MLYKAFIQPWAMTTGMITQKADMGTNNNNLSQTAKAGIILEMQKKHIL